jgi:hypothetical protein
MTGPRGPVATWPNGWVRRAEPSQICYPPAQRIAPSPYRPEPLVLRARGSIPEQGCEGDASFSARV